MANKRSVCHHNKASMYDGTISSLPYPSAIYLRPDENISNFSSLCQHTSVSRNHFGPCRGVLGSVKGLCLELTYGLLEQTPIHRLIKLKN